MSKCKAVLDGQRVKSLKIKTKTEKNKEQKETKTAQEKNK